MPLDDLEHFRRVIDEHRDGIVVLVDGCVRYCNQRLQELIGREGEELIGRSFLEAIVEEDRERVNAFHQARLAGETAPSQYDVSLLRADGSRQQVEVVAQRMELNGHASIVATCHDTSERHRLQQMFADIVKATASCGGQELFDLVVRSLIGWLQVDHACLVACPETGIEILACHDGGQLLPPAERAALLTNLIGTPDGGRSTHDQAAACCNTLCQTDLAAGILGMPVHGSDGRLLAVLCVRNQRPIALPTFAHDLELIITARLALEIERMQVEATMRFQQEQTIRAERLRSLGEMASSMAHEFFQPLSIIRGSAEHMMIGLERGWNITIDEQTKAYRQIMDQVDRTSGLIDHLRRFAHRADREELQPTDLAEPIHAALRMCKAQLAAHGINHEINVASGVHWSEINPFAIEELIICLVSNARDALDDLGDDSERQRLISISIEAGHCDGRDWQVIHVDDSGPGIPADMHHRVFDPFFTTKGPDRGTGLGLVTARNIVTQSGGHLSLGESRHGGCRFSAALPMCPAPVGAEHG